MKGFKKFGKRAFSFTEVMIAAGLLGGLGLFSLNLNESQTADQSFSATALAIETLYQRIYLNVEDHSVCTQTLQGISGQIDNGNTINDIYDRQGNVFISKGDSDNRGLVEIDSIELANLNKVSSNLNAEVDLKITFKKLSRALASSSGGTERKVAYTVPLQIILRSNGNFERCPAPADDAKQKALCEDFYGTWNSGTKKCQLPFFGSNCPAGEGVQSLQGNDANNINLGCDDAVRD